MALFGKGKKDASGMGAALAEEIILPKHVGIIMDGNGRWAKLRGLPRKAGHREGAQTFRTITRYEVGALMGLFKSYLKEALEDFQDDDIVVRFIGDKSGFSPELQALMTENEESSKNRDGMVLNIAMNYGSRDEIVRAVRQISEEVRSGALRPEDVSEQLISDRLYTAGQPDPDLIIRPSGEYRISNFMLWQAAYTEFVIMNKLWPDFTKADLDEALRIYSQRNRRYGGV